MKVRTAPESAYDCWCFTCEKAFKEPGSARRHAREQMHRVRIVETLDGRTTRRPAGT